MIFYMGILISVFLEQTGQQKTQDGISPCSNIIRFCVYLIVLFVFSAEVFNFNFLILCLSVAASWSYTQV